MTIGQFDIPGGLNPMTTTAWNMTTSQIQSGSVARLLVAMMPFPASITHAEKLEKFNSLNFKSC